MLGNESLAVLKKMEKILLLLKGDGKGRRIEF